MQRGRNLVNGDKDEYILLVQSKHFRGHPSLCSYSTCTALATMQGTQTRGQAYRLAGGERRRGGSVMGAHQASQSLLISLALCRDVPHDLSSLNSSISRTVQQYKMEIHFTVKTSFRCEDSFHILQQDINPRTKQAYSAFLIWCKTVQCSPALIHNSAVFTCCGTLEYSANLLWYTTAQGLPPKVPHCTKLACNTTHHCSAYLS